MQVISLSALKTVAALKLKLTMRHYRRNLGNAFAVIAGMLFGLVLAVAGGTVAFVLIHDGGSSMRDAWMPGAVWVICLLWSLGPLMQIDAQRSLDLSMLRIYPVSRGTFTGAVLLDGLVSPQGMFFLPFLIASIAVFSLSATELPVAIAAHILMLATILCLTQGIYLLANRILTSRKYADASIIIGVVFFVSIQTVNLMITATDNPAVPGWVIKVWETGKLVISPVLAWLFPGLAARSVQAAGSGDWLNTALLLGLLLAQAAIAYWFLNHVVARFYEGDLESGGRENNNKVRSRNILSSVLPGTLSNLVHREQLYLFRDPMLKMLFIQTVLGALYMSVVMGFMGFRNMTFDGELSSVGSFIRTYALVGMSLFLGFSESHVLFNKFGYEGKLACHMLLSPVSRRSILVAKSVFYLSHFATVNVILIIFLAIILKTPLIYATAAALLVIHNSMIVDVAGHFISILMPFTYRRKGQRMRAVMPQPGCGYMLLYALAFNVGNLVVLPGAACIVAGAVLGGWPGLALGAIAAAGYVFLAYHFGLAKAADLMVTREPQLAAALSKLPD